ITPEEAAAFIAHLRSSTSLAPVHDVSVLLVSVEPTPVGTEGAAEVIPASKSLRVNVVVANAGNDRQKGVPVVAEVRWGDGQVDTARQFVDLVPGQRATVTIGGLHMPPEGVTALSVNVGPVDGEANLADNQRQKTLVQR
ncbi:MAG: hypothetical protein LC792_18405, partial [Actinobacteria bacterium]|nr:hypothetical protein [Actinomycetota bacterium]